MQVAIFTPNASNLKAHNTTNAIINACVQAKSGESTNLMSWQVLSSDILISELIPLGDAPYKLSVIINRPTKQALLISIDNLIDEQCAQVIIKGAKGTKVNYLEGTYLDYQLNDESVLIKA